MPERRVCGSCDSTDLEPFLDLGYTPLANAFPSSPSEKETKYRLQVAICMNCHLVQLLEVVPDDILFANNTFYSGTGDPSYWQGVARNLMKRFGDDGPQLTVEIACNDGTLLKHFHDAGWPSVGVDPAEGPTQKAREYGLDVLTMPFGSDAAEGIRAEYGQAGLIIGNNVLAHVSDLNDFLQGVKRLLKPDGVAVFEFQYLGDLVTGNMFDHVYHEHRFFYSITALQTAVMKNKMLIDRWRPTPQQGGSMQVEITHGGVYRGTPDPWLTRLNTMRGVQPRVDYIKSRLQSLIATEMMMLPGFLAGYAAPAKSTTLLNFCGIDHDTLDYIVDTTPSKIGKYTPGTHIPIISPEQEDKVGYPDTYLLLAWNYLSSILRRADLQGPSSTRWVVPVPIPYVI